MRGVIVLPRVHQRHPELDDEDVIVAWEGAVKSAPRLGKNPDEYISLGFDGKGRLIEVAAARDLSGTWVIFHATTPPSDKTFKEFGIGR